MTTIERSIGIPAKVGIVTYGMAGGGYSGTTAELDTVVQHAAELLGKAYAMDVTIRFNSDRESGGAWLKTHGRDSIGGNAEIGICASVVTERTRRQREAMLAKHGASDPEWASELRELIAEPIGTIRVYAHLSGRACRAGVLEDGESYYHRMHLSVEGALAFVRAHGQLVVPEWEAEGITEIAWHLRRRVRELDGKRVRLTYYNAHKTATFDPIARTLTIRRVGDQDDVLLDGYGGTLYWDQLAAVEVKVGNRFKPWEIS